MAYSLDEHRHRFAAWAAARAAQRAFASVPELISALEASGLPERLRSAEWQNWPASAEAFDQFHRETCRRIVGHLLPAHPDAGYGRAAKLVAIYIKALVVCGGHAEHPLASVAHPPIDRILLQNLAKKPRLSSCGDKAWTQLDEDEYFELIRLLREEGLSSPRFWEVEEAWSASESDT